ncbi:PAS domain-containing sensor histidine kinase [Maribacter arcticus]|uniref:histidine kinase n=1 Tax=Maribacter arcticus TaxID=561365 RepID=A0A1T5EKD9_9FLAO|nr:ATP-binding protein [Maribacter arcticus]SKB84376.1 PAS domain S-box-containing protein [Maribacter arcticus]
MTNISTNNFFKNIVDGSNEALVFVSPNAEISNEINQYVIVYANKKAESLFANTQESIQNREIKELPKFLEFGELLNHLNSVIKSKKHEAFNFVQKVGHKNLNMHFKIESHDSGLLIGITEAKVSYVVHKESNLQEDDLKARINELEISNLFSYGVLDSYDSMVSYLRPIFDDHYVISDFRIDYINNRMDDITQEESEFIIGKTFCEYYPQNFENGVFEKLKECFYSGQNQDYIKEFFFNEQSYWLSNRAVKMNDGIILFSKDITREKKNEEQLFIQNRLLLEAEHVANIGSFRWNLGKEEIKYSENVYRMFGFEPKELDSKYDRLLAFVHPNDIDKVKDSFHQARISKTKTDLVFRIYTKSNDLKYMNTIGECYQKEGNRYMVGVIRDVTKQIEAESKLQAKNAELKRTNSDLEAFNRVASHDLQEPLRKIQMFVSRLFEEEKDSMSLRSQGYLEKVKSSSNRMRNLINNLLSYSKVDEVEEQPKRIDLNDVLISALDDLGERIDDIGAEVASDALPVVNGVQFQLEQLFANLIGNSLKYVKKETRAKIQIKSKIISRNEIPTELLSFGGNFVKLQFIDNGIGFEKKYEEKIFEIFQRLHGKNEFSGTGLGLSICKKIVQSHNGIIQAKGELDKGAEFTIYLPVLQ